MSNFVQDLAVAVRAFCEKRGESDHAFARRIGMLPQNFYDFMRRSKDDDFDPGRHRLEKIAAGAGVRIMLVPDALVPEIEALLAGGPKPLDSLTPIAVLDLSARTTRALEGQYIARIADLVECDADDLLAIRGFGRGCLREVETTLASHGLKLKGGAS